MRKPSEDELADYREQDLEERWARKTGKRCTCAHMPMKYCPIHDTTEGDEDE